MLCGTVAFCPVHESPFMPCEHTQESLQMSLSLIPPTAQVGLITYGRHVSVCACVCVCVHVRMCVCRHECESE